MTDYPTRVVQHDVRPDKLRRGDQFGARFVDSVDVKRTLVHVTYTDGTTQQFKMNQVLPCTVLRAELTDARR